MRWSRARDRSRPEPEPSVGDVLAGRIAELVTPGGRRSSTPEFEPFDFSRHRPVEIPRPDPPAVARRAPAVEEPVNHYAHIVDDQHPVQVSSDDAPPLAKRQPGKRSRRSRPAEEPPVERRRDRVETPRRESGPPSPEPVPTRVVPIQLVSTEQVAHPAAESLPKRPAESIPTPARRRAREDTSDAAPVDRTPNTDPPNTTRRGGRRARGRHSAEPRPPRVDVIPTEQLARDIPPPIEIAPTELTPTEVLGDAGTGTSEGFTTRGFAPDDFPPTTVRVPGSDRAPGAQAVVDQSVAGHDQFGPGTFDPAEFDVAGWAPEIETPVRVPEARTASGDDQEKTERHEVDEVVVGGRTGLVPFGVDHAKYLDPDAFHQRRRHHSGLGRRFGARLIKGAVLCLVAVAVGLIINGVFPSTPRMLTNIVNGVADPSGPTDAPSEETAVPRGRQRSLPKPARIEPGDQRSHHDPQVIDTTSRLPDGAVTDRTPATSGATHG